MTDRKMTLKGEVREPLSPISAARASARSPSRARSVSKHPKTPGSCKKPVGKTENYGYDRFIPNRNIMDNDVSDYILYLNAFVYDNNILFLVVWAYAHLKILACGGVCMHYMNMRRCMCGCVCMHMHM